MKKMYYAVLIIILCSGITFAQTFDLQFIEEQNDGVLGGEFDVRIQIRSVTSTFDMGTSNLVFSYNNSALTWDSVDSLTTWNFSGFMPPSTFYTMELERPFADVISINIVLGSGAGSGQTVVTNWMDVATVHFTIADPAQTSNLLWRTTPPNRTNVFDDQALPVEIPASNLNPGDFSLPVELTSFTANISDDLDVILKWVTESEINNQGFEVYRSDNEEGVFDIISSYTTNQNLVGQGNSSTKNTYSFTDQTVIRKNTYWYKICDVDFNGNKTSHGPISILVKSGNSSNNEENMIPDNFELSQNYPNPFNPETQIRIGIPDEQDIGEIVVDVYDIIGKKVKTLFKGNLEPGIHTIRWNGSDESGKQVSGGTYFYYLKSNKFHQIKKMIFMK